MLKIGLCDVSTGHLYQSIEGTDVLWVSLFKSNILHIMATI